MEVEFPGRPLPTLQVLRPQWARWFDLVRRSDLNLVKWKYQLRSFNVRQDFGQRHAVPPRMSGSHTMTPSVGSITPVSRTSKELSLHAPGRKAKVQVLQKCSKHIERPRHATLRY